MCTVYLVKYFPIIIKNVTFLTFDRCSILFIYIICICYRFNNTSKLYLIKNYCNMKFTEMLKDKCFPNKFKRNILM